MINRLINFRFSHHLNYVSSCMSLAATQSISLFTDLYSEISVACSFSILCHHSHD
jgi:hypothetical protein